VSADRARPFPFAALEKLTRADVQAAARMTRAARRHVRLSAVGAAATEVTGADVQLAVRSVRVADVRRGTDDAVGVVIALTGDPSPAARVLVEAPSALAGAIVARALRQKPPKVVDASRAAPAALVGAFAAIVSAVLRRSHAGVAVRVVAAGPAAALARDLAAVAGGLTSAWLTVTMGGEAFEARVTIPDAIAATPYLAEAAHADLLRMGDARLVLPIVIARTLASRFDLAALAPGDAFVPSGCALATAEDRALHGNVALVAPAAELGVAAELAGGGRLVIGGLLESHPWAPEVCMPSDERSNATLEAVLDAPVVVRVELGSLTMTAREWADLGPGDVVTLGRKLGDLAILRVGGAELARGELVQVDGEVAVRIVERTGELAGGPGGQS